MHPMHPLFSMAEGDSGAPEVAKPEHVPGSHSTTIFIFGFVTVAATVLALLYCRSLVEDPARTPASSTIGAYGITFIGALNGSLMFIVVHDLDPSMTWNEATFWTSLARLLFALPVVIWEKYNEFNAKKEKDPEQPATPSETTGLVEKDTPAENAWWVVTPEQWASFGMLTLRCCMSVFSGNIAPYVGVQFLPISDAAALSALTPFFAMLFSSLFLNEHLSYNTLGFVAVAFVGVLFVLRPVDMVSWMWMGEESPMYLSNQVTAMAATITLLGAVVGGALGPIMRGWKWPVWDVVAYVGFVGVVVSLVIDALFSQYFFTNSVHFDDSSQHCWSWASTHASANAILAITWLFLLGVSSFNKTLCINWAWKLDHAGAIEMVYVSLVIGMQLYFQLFVFQVLPLPSLCGCKCARVCGVCVRACVRACVCTARERRSGIQSVSLSQSVLVVRVSPPGEQSLPPSGPSRPRVASQSFLEPAILYGARCRSLAIV